MILELWVLNPSNHLVRLGLVFPFYIGILACLEGSTSFCVLHAARGTYDLHEPRGFASKKSGTLEKVGSEDWKRLDQRKALWMHLEAVTGAVLLAILLALT
jgi:anti-sigma-K factor RskA